MNRDEMLLAIEDEIARLKQVRTLLLESASDRFAGVGIGRAPDAKKPRMLSADARGRIAEAQKRRWAKERSDKALGAEPKDEGA